MTRDGALWHADSTERRGGTPAACSYPSAQRKHELPGPYLTALGTQHSRIATFAAVLTKPHLIVPDLDTAVLRLESTWWRDRAEQRVNRYFREQSNVADQLESIRVQPGSYTFGSKSGQIPLTISNGVNQEVIVVLRLDPRQPRIRLDPAPNPIRIGPGRKLQVPIPADGRGGRRRGRSTRRCAPAAERRCRTDRCRCGSGSRSSAPSRCSSPAAPPACCSWRRACECSAAAWPPGGSPPVTTEEPA